MHTQNIKQTMVQVNVTASNEHRLWRNSTYGNRITKITLNLGLDLNWTTELQVDIEL